MSSAGVNQVFSVPYCHLWDSQFDGLLAASAVRPLGLARFIGDDANQLLRYLDPEHKTDKSSINQNRFLYPIVLYGPSGTGKTSLALTIISGSSDSVDNPEDTSLNAQPADKPVFLTALDFDRRFRSALETDSISDFRYRLIDSGGLVIDDLHRLVKKPAAQKEFIHLLDEMCRRCRPVVVTMVNSPLSCTGFSSQLVSRLSAGLNLPVNPPGPAARSEIIRGLAQINNIELTNDAIGLLVDRLNVTVPKLDHFFAQLDANLRLLSNVSTTKNSVKSHVVDSLRLTKIFKTSDSDRMVRSILIIKLVAKEFHLKVAELKGSSRKQSIVMARGIAIYLNRSLLDISFLKIGAFFGNRDHSTIMHAYRKINRLVADSGSDTDTTTIKKTVHKLKQDLTEQFASQINFL